MFGCAAGERGTNPVSQIVRDGVVELDHCGGFRWYAWFADFLAWSALGERDRRCVSMLEDERGRESVGVWRVIARECNDASCMSHGWLERVD